MAASVLVLTSPAFEEGGWIPVEHRYTFTVHAVDRFIDVPPSGRCADVLQAIDGHILQTATLSGRFRKGRA